MLHPAGTCVVFVCTTVVAFVVAAFVVVTAFVVVVFVVGWVVGVTVMLTCTVYVVVSKPMKSKLVVSVVGKQPRR